MIDRFRVQNYKCLKDVDIPLTPVHVLIGQNDSGKTSLLEAMYALFRVSQEGAQLLDGFPGKWNGRELVLGRNANPQVRIGALTSDPVQATGRSAFYRLTCEFSDSGRTCRLVEERIDADIFPEQSGRTFLAYNRAQSYSNQNPLMRQIAPHFDGATIHRFAPKVMAIPSAIKPESGFRLERDGFGLPTLLDDIVKYDFRQFELLEGELKQYFNNVKRLYTKTASGFDRVAVGQEQDVFQYNQYLSSSEVWLETTLGTIRLQQASDGLILLLGFLALARAPRPPRMILIEEPENGIYPKRLDEVVRMIKQYVAETPNAPQVVMTTHSPYMLSAFTPEEVTFMSRQPDGSARARPLREAKNVDKLLGEDVFYLGELWYNYSEQEIFGDAQSESEYRPGQAEPLAAASF